MRILARVPNTVVKISGLGMSEPGWTTDTLAPWILECVELWGCDRAFFGTNWPVDRLFSSYDDDVVASYREIISTCSSGEQRALLAGRAIVSSESPPKTRRVDRDGRNVHEAPSPHACPQGQSHDPA